MKRYRVPESESPEAFGHEHGADAAAGPPAGEMTPCHGAPNKPGLHALGFYGILMFGRPLMWKSTHFRVRVSRKEYQLE